MWDDDISRGTRTQLVRTTKYLSLRLRRVVRYKKLPHTKYALIVWCHQAPLTPPSFAYHTTSLRDPCYAGIASAHSENRADSFLSGVSTLRDHHQRFATRHLSTASVPAKPAVPGHHPPPLRSPDDRLVVALIDLPLFCYRRLTDKSVRLLDVT